MPKRANKEIIKPTFGEIGMALNEWADSRFEHKRNSDAVLALAAELGLEREFMTDVRIAFAYLRGYMQAQKDHRGELMP